MAIECKERPRQQASVEFGKHESTREYWVSGTTEKADALLAMGSTSPGQDQVLDLNGTAINLFRKGVDAREIGNGVWEGQVRYGNTPDQYELSFNNGVQSTKIFQAKATTRIYDCVDGTTATSGATANVPDFKNAVNVTASGIDGVDAEIGKCEFSLKKKYKFATLSADYESLLASITPCVNRGTWAFVWKTQVFAFPQGAVLFRGHTTNQNSDDDLEITHNFAYSKGLTLAATVWVAGTYSIGDEVTYVDYLWRSLANGNTETPTVYNDWDVGTAYLIGEKVQYNGILYEAIDNNNGNQPDITPLHWLSLGLIEWEIIGAADWFKIGDSAPIVKEGWEYGWPWYKPGVAVGTVIQVPTGFIINQIYDYEDFDQFQIF